METYARTSWLRRQPITKTTLNAHIRAWVGSRQTSSPKASQRSTTNVGFQFQTDETWGEGHTIRDAASAGDAAGNSSALQQNGVTGGVPVIRPTQ